MKSMTKHQVSVTNPRSSGGWGLGTHDRCFASDDKEGAV